MATDKMTPEEGIRYVVDGGFGRYVWQTLVQRFAIENVDEEDLEIIAEGPDHPEHDYAVESLIALGRVRDIHNDCWAIDSHPDDGGVILVHPDFDWVDWE